MKSQKKKENALNWFLWWRIDPEELQKQIAEYSSLKITKSARGISLLLLVLSAFITLLLIFFAGYEATALFDILIMLGIGFFIYKGHRWAMILAMVAWTLEKAFQLFMPIVEGGQMPNPIILLTWWAIYMHAFYLAYKVETERKKADKSEVENQNAIIE